MKKATVLFLIMALLVIIVVPAYAQSGVSGRLWDSDSPSSPWTSGADIYALNCDANGNIIGTEVYATIDLTGAEVPTGSFSEAWLTDELSVGSLVTPGAGDLVCLYIVWGAGSQGQPPDTITNTVPFLAFIPGPMSFGNVQSGTGPTAISLQGIGSSAATSMPVVAGLALLVLVGATFIVMRRRQVA